jgi:hypothetical protein
MFADWDIPSDQGVGNGSGDYLSSSPSFHLIWQRGAEMSTGDEGPPHDCPILENDRLGGIATMSGSPRNAWTARAATMTSGSGLNPDSLYNRMSGPFGFNLYHGVGQDSVADLHTGVTFATVDLSGDMRYTFVVALATTNQGPTDFYDQIAQAHLWTADWPYPPPCACRVGDANNDGTANVGDAVYIINILFRSGPPPQPYPVCSGDANRDCTVNVGDVVYLVNFIFKGGPGPGSCDSWTAECGPYQMK